MMNLGFNISSMYVQKSVKQVLYPTGCVRNVDVKRRIFGAWTLIYRRECVVLMMSYICSRPLTHLQRDRAIVLHYDDAG